MKEFLALAALAAMAFGQSTPVPATPPSVEVGSAGPSTLLPDVPPLPKGKSTVIGGVISNLDRVRDELTVHVFGSHQTMRILFDERSRVVRDGVQVSAHDLRNGDHVSLETVLDGSTIFARDIHVLGHTVSGECSGQILRYDSTRGELFIHDPLSPEPVKLHVSSATIVRAEGQQPAGTPLNELRQGTLVSAQFSPDSHGQSVARQLLILATSGTTFTFVGKVTYLDVHAGLLVLTDPRTNQTYEILFDRARIPVIDQVHDGSDLSVTTKFDGSHYTASDMVLTSVNK